MNATLRVMAVLAGSGAALAAADPNTLTAAEKTAGWRLLFDGKTLDGWDDSSAVSPGASAWTVADGCIQTVPRARVRGDLVSKAAFDNFEMGFEWKIEARGNSGVKYRIQARVPLDLAKTPQFRRHEDRVDFELRNRVTRREALTPGALFEEYLVAFEYQLIDDDGHSDARSGLDRTAGALYSMVPPLKRAAKPVGQFNESRIVLRGNRVEHWMNGEKVLDARLDDPVVGEKLMKRWSKENKVYELLTTQPHKRTPVALQHHVDQVWFRSVKIRPL